MPSTAGEPPQPLLAGTTRQVGSGEGCTLENRKPTPFFLSPFIQKHSGIVPKYRFRCRARHASFPAPSNSHRARKLKVGTPTPTTRLAQHPIEDRHYCCTHLGPDEALLGSGGGRRALIPGPPPAGRVAVPVAIGPVAVRRAASSAPCHPTTLLALAPENVAGCNQLRVSPPRPQTR